MKEMDLSQPFEYKLGDIIYWEVPDYPNKDCLFIAYKFAPTRYTSKNCIWWLPLWGQEQSYNRPFWWETLWHEPGEPYIKTVWRSEID